MLYTSQEIVIQELDNALLDNQHIAIIGNIQSGKSFSVKEFLKNSNNSQTEILIFDRSEQNDDCYAPFEKASRKSANVLDDTLNKLMTENRDKDYSKPQIFISLFDHLKYARTRKNKNPFFKEDEEQFLSKINQKLTHNIGVTFLENSKKTPLLKKRVLKNNLVEAINTNSCILFLEELNTWDNNSLILVKKLIEKGHEAFPLICKAKIIYTLSSNYKLDNEKAEIIDTIFKKTKTKIISMPKLSDSDYMKFIREKSFEGIHFDDQQHTQLVELLKEFSKDNLEEIPDLIEEIHRIILENHVIYDINQSKFYNLLKEKLSYNNIGYDQSELILEYASLMGNTFTKKELVLITELNDDQFRTIVDRVIKINVLKKSASSSENTYKFVSTFFYEIFKTKALIKRDEYHKKIERIVNQIYPHKYEKRAYYLSQTETAIKMTQKLYFLSLLNQVRNRQELDTAIINKLDKENQVLLSRFIKVYKLIRNNQYDNAIITLTLIKSQSSDVSKTCESDLLLALCYSKKITPEKRKESINLLEEYINNEELQDDFSELYERLLMRLFIMYVHANELNRAKQLYTTLITRLEIYDYDNIDATIKKNTLYRVANTIFNEETSELLMKDAKEYFHKNQSYSNGIVNYYLSLCNYSGSQIMTGSFEDAFETTKLAEQLVSEHSTIEFPRPHILLNNYLLSGYLSNKLTVNYVLTSFEEIISRLGVNAERLFFVSNLSIFHAINNNYSAAFKILSEENTIQNASRDIEGKYDARVRFNLSIYNFLLGHTQKGISDMKKYSEYLLESDDPDKELNRCQQIIITMENSTDEIDGTAWLEVLLQDSIVGSVREIRTNLNSNNYKNLGYMFTTLYNWDI